MALNEWSEKQILGLTGGVVVGVLVIMGGLVGYTYAKYATLKEDTETLKRQNKALQKTADTLEEKKKLRDDLFKDTEFHQKKLPDDKDLGDLRNQVSEQSRNTKIDITAINEVESGRKAKPGQSGKGSKERYIPVKMKMEASGEFHHFGQFLNRLESRIDRLVAVKGFELTANKDGLNPKKPELKIKLQFDAYRYKTR